MEVMTYIWECNHRFGITAAMHIKFIYGLSEHERLAHILLTFYPSHTT